MPQLKHTQPWKLHCFLEIDGFYQGSCVAWSTKTGENFLLEQIIGKGKGLFIFNAIEESDWKNDLAIFALLFERFHNYLPI